jgi:hypothetical protein
MVGIVWFPILALLYVIVEYGCSETRASRRMNWFQLIASGQVTPVKRRTR